MPVELPSVGAVQALSVFVAGADRTVAQWRAQGHPIGDADVARLSPFVHRHINVHGAYSFANWPGVADPA